MWVFRRFVRRWVKKNKPCIKVEPRKKPHKKWVYPDLSILKEEDVIRMYIDYRREKERHEGSGAYTYPMFRGIIKKRCKFSKNV